MLRQGGRLAFPSGVEPEPENRRGIEIISYDAVAGVREFQRLGRAVEQSKLQVPIAGAYPLADAAKAHERLAAGHVLGKIVLWGSRNIEKQRMTLTFSARSNSAITGSKVASLWRRLLAVGQDRAMCPVR